MTQEPFEELDGDQEISDLENHNSCDDREAIEPEEPEDVSRRDFFRKSAEIAAMALFGSVGIDLLVEEVTKRMKEFEGISKLADSVCVNIQHLGLSRSAFAESDPNCDPLNWFNNCPPDGGGPAPDNCGAGNPPASFGEDDCQGTHWYNACNKPDADYTCDKYNCGAESGVQIGFVCGGVDDSGKKEGGFECDDFKCVPNGDDKIIDFWCSGGGGKRE